MIIKGDKFYVFEAGNGKRIYDSEEEAIESMKKLMGKDKAINPEDVTILEVDTSDESWKIVSIPWSKIALGLIRSG